MKYALSFLFAVVLTINVQGQDIGIEFMHADWETTLKTAEKEDKIIFVDAYTTWCGPCKWMDANVFSEESVGDYFNEHFINAKIDMEAGEGLLFAKAYAVNAYPTLLFINGKGDMVHKGLGGRAPEDFIALGQAANDPNQQIGSLEKKYKSGDKDAAFLKSYASALTSAGMSGASSIAQEYLETQEDWTTEENMEFIFDMADYRNMDDVLFQEVAKNKDAYSNLLGADMVNYGLSMAPRVRASSIPNINRQQIEAIFNQVFPDNYKQHADEFEMETLYGKPEYVQAAVDYLSKYDIKNSNQLNQIAWSVYELTDDKKILNMAKEWTEKSIELDANHMNHDTLAAICYKLKDKKEAMKHANIAIEMAKADGQDASHTEKLLKQIESM